MPEFSIGEAWTQFVAYVGEHWRTIAIIAAVTSLASAVLQVVMLGGSPEAFAQTLVTQMQGRQLAALGNAGLLMGLAGLAGALISMAGQFVALRATLAREEIGSALSYATMAALLMLLFVFAVALVFGVLFAVVAMAVGAGSSPTTVGSIALLLVLILIPLLFWLAARFSVVSVAMAEARSTNPLFGLAASWRLTGPSQWAILGFIVIIFIAALAVTLIYSMIVGVITGLIGGVVGAILSAVLIGVPQAIFSLGIGVGIYRALVPNDTHSVFT